MHNIVQYSEKCEIAYNIISDYEKRGKSVIINSFYKQFSSNQVVSIDDILYVAPWLLFSDVKFNNAVIDIDRDEKKRIIWYSGTWIAGEWDSGSWLNGIWLDGEWCNGIWYDGTWLGGIWWDGIWCNGRWNGGKWMNGTWHKGKVDDTLCLDEPLRNNL